MEKTIVAKGTVVISELKSISRLTLSMEKTIVAKGTVVISELKSISRLMIVPETGPWSLFKTSNLHTEV